MASDIAELGSSKKTAATTVYDAIRKDILAGELQPGARLRIDALCKRYEVTINPVREALNRLVAERLVDLADQRGFGVAPISLVNWRDLVRSRVLVESIALREAMANRTQAWEEGIVIALYRLSRTKRFADGDTLVANPEWEPRHHAFHNALLVTCNSPILLDFCEDLRERSDRYRHIASISPAARQTYPEEHQEIADATIAGHADLACSLLAAHYERTLAVVEDFLTRDR